jgi:hypothetical protein
MEEEMQMIRDIGLQFAVITLLILGLVLAPVIPGMALAADGAGVGVSGPDRGPASTGKGARAPPPEGTTATEEKAPVKSAEDKPAKTSEPQEVPKGIAASAGTAGAAATASGGGISLGWKIAGGVLGVGLLVGLAGGGGSSSGGGTTPSH